MWAFALPLWDYVLVGFCPTGFCPDTVYSIGGFERALPPKNAVKSPISPTHYENANEAGLLSRYYWTVDNANLPRFARRSYLLD